MKKIIAIALSAAIMGSLLVGCGAPAAAPVAEAPKAEAPKADAPKADAPAATGEVTIAMLPKFKGENYFDACKVGAEEAVAELGNVKLLYDGPPQNDATNQKQVDILEGWIAQDVNVIIMSPNDPEAIALTLQKARDKGIKVLTYDADAKVDARDLFINQVTAAGVAKGLVQGTADKLAAKGYGESKPANIAMVSSAETDANQNSWIAEIKALLALPEFTWMKLDDKNIYYPGPAEDRNIETCATLVGAMAEGEGKIQAVIGLTSMATPALGAAYDSVATKPDVSKVVLTGLATPNAIKDYIKNAANPLDAGVLWNCMDLGYLAVQTGYQFATGKIAADATSITAGRLGEKAIADGVVILGDALVFDAANVDQFNY